MYGCFAGIGHDRFGFRRFDVDHAQFEHAIRDLAGQILVQPVEHHRSFQRAPRLIGQRVNVDLVAKADQRDLRLCQIDRIPGLQRSSGLCIPGKLHRQRNINLHAQFGHRQRPVTRAIDQHHRLCSEVPRSENLRCAGQAFATHRHIRDHHTGRDVGLRC